ncbi:hypothetical protein, partial [Rhodobaculum claviforme]
DAPGPIAADGATPPAARARYRGLVVGLLAVLAVGVVAVALYAQARTAAAPPAGLVAFADAMDSAAAALGAAGDQLRRELAALIAGR